MTVRHLAVWVPISAASIEKAASMLLHLGDMALVLICARTYAPDVEKACDAWPDRIPFPSVAYVHDSLLKDPRSWSLGGYEEVVISEFMPSAVGSVAMAEIRIPEPVAAVVPEHHGPAVVLPEDKPEADPDVAIERRRTGKPKSRRSIDE